MRSNRQIDNSPPGPPSYRRFVSEYPSHFENFTVLAFVKLVVGALVFLGLCSSLIFLVIPVGRVLEGEINASSVTQLAIALSLVSSLAGLLFLLGRKPRAERAALSGNLVAMQFAKRKLYLQLSSLGLVALAIGGMGFAVKRFQVGSSIAFLSVAFVSVGYWALGRALWRCPGCGHRLSFLRRNRDTQATKNCPACHVRLQ